ncbi:hypothetical protein ACIGPN_06075 [Streptomyces afghaniensis]|uniref:hypothetical protein n=1 Tax=Streptomyces afghaniensis TaxID=66865 RepID=UPI0037CDA2FE
MARIGEARIVQGEAYDTIEIDYETAGGIRKTLRLAHGDADILRVRIVGEIEGMEPERRKRSFLASLRRKR